MAAGWAREIPLADVLRLTHGSEEDPNHLSTYTRFVSVRRRRSRIYAKRKLRNDKTRLQDEGYAAAQLHSQHSPRTVTTATYQLVNRHETLRAPLQVVKWANHGATYHRSTTHDDNNGRQYRRPRYRHSPRRPRSPIQSYLDYLWRLDQRETSTSTTPPKDTLQKLPSPHLRRQSSFFQIE